MSTRRIGQHQRTTTATGAQPICLQNHRCKLIMKMLAARLRKLHDVTQLTPSLTDSLATSNRNPAEHCQSSNTTIKSTKSRSAIPHPHKHGNVQRQHENGTHQRHKQLQNTMMSKFMLSMQRMTQEMQTQIAHTWHILKPRNDTTQQRKHCCKNRCERIANKIIIRITNTQPRTQLQHHDGNNNGR